MPVYTYRDSAPRKPYEEPGEYKVTVENFEFGIASGSGNAILKLVLRTEAGALVYDNLVFTDKSFWKIDHALKAFLPSKGFTAPGKNESFDLNFDYAQDRLLGASGWVLLSKSTTPGGKIRNEVESYLPPKNGSPAHGTTTKPAAPGPATSATSATTKPNDDDDEIPF